MLRKQQIIFLIINFKKKVNHIIRYIAAHKIYINKSIMIKYLLKKQRNYFKHKLNNSVNTKNNLMF